MMKYLNIVPIVENHEVMGITCLRFLMKEITENNISEMDDVVVEELLNWQRTDYDSKYYDDVFMILGHVIIQNIEENPRLGYIYRKNNHIAIDCGACFGGRLSAICLDTDEEFYVEYNN